MTAPRTAPGALALVLLLLGATARAQPLAPAAPDDDEPGVAARPPPAGADVEEKLGEKVPLDLTFTDEAGRPVRLGELLAGDKPTVLVLAYFRCPVLCGLVLSGLTTSMRGLNRAPGDGYRAITLSIDPGETPADAAAKKATVLGEIEADLASVEWPFLVGEEPQIAALADAVGFRYRREEKTGQYIHPAVVVVLGPDGKVSRYLYGVEYRPMDLRLALLEAAEGRVGTSTDRFILACYRWDPVSRQYVSWAFTFIRFGALGVALGLGFLLTRLWRRERLSGRRP